jgi:hypothetical protein
MARDLVDTFVDEMRRAAEDDMTRRRSWLRRKRLESRLQRLLSEMTPAEQERALRLAENYAAALEERAFGH